MPETKISSLSPPVIVRSSRKCVLYHDIDGILFSTYGPRSVHQLRPGVHDWFHWVLTRFDVIFLTSWPEADLRSLLKALYLHDVSTACPYLSWFHLGTKWAALDAHRFTHNRPWFWIDDDPAVFPPLIEQKQIFAGLPFVRVNPTGANELPNVMQRLNHRVEKMRVLLGPDYEG